MTLSVGIVGSGAYGSGLANCALSKGHRVGLVTRGDLNLQQPNLQLYPTYDFLKDTDLIFLAVPSTHMLALAQKLAPVLDGRHCVVHLSRGLIHDELHAISDSICERTAVRRVGVLAGPLMPGAIDKPARGGVVIGSRFHEVQKCVREALESPTLRVYEQDDTVGTEVASALTGLLMIALGAAQSLGLSAADLGVLATHGIQEMVRISRKLHVEDKGFFGLAGIGDLIAALHDEGRPEFLVGQALAQGKDLRTTLSDVGSYIEGIALIRRLHAYVRRTHIAAPITDAMSQLLETGVSPDELRRMLTTR